MNRAGFIKADRERERAFLDKAARLGDLGLGVGTVALGPRDGDDLQSSDSEPNRRTTPPNTQGKPSTEVN